MSDPDCIIAGGGPAGIMFGLLLARGGVCVTIFEKHADFLRDFRGDTVHPSTIELLDELGLGEGFRGLPQSRVDEFRLPDGSGNEVPLANFTSFKPPYDHIALVPQWDFLNFLVKDGAQYPGFDLRMQTEVTGLTRDGNRVTGVTWRTDNGEKGKISAPLVVACDGRDSAIRDSLNLPISRYSVPFDLWWFRLPRHASDDDEIAGILPTFKDRDIMLTINRDTYYQVAYFIEKGSDQDRRKEGLAAFQKHIAHIRPDFADRVETIESFDEVKTLDVQLNRLDQWYRDGVLCIGDAAHAMSPAGGVGINLAIQDAVAAAAILRDPLRKARLDTSHLAAVQKRRMFPTRVIQRFQRILHRVMFEPAFEGKRSGAPAFLIWLARHIPAFGRLPAWLVGFGPRPEHAPRFARSSKRLTSGNRKPT